MTCNARLLPLLLVFVLRFKLTRLQSFGGCEDEPFAADVLEQRFDKMLILKPIQDQHSAFGDLYNIRRRRLVRVGVRAHRK